MNSTELVNYWRETVKDTVSPYFWSDSEAYAYAQAAYVMFTRLTDGVSDFTSEACEVDVVAGEPVVELHPSILTIRQATRRSDGGVVEVVNHTDLATLTRTRYGTPVPVSMGKSVGKVTHVVVGMQRNRARLINIPATDDALDLLIYRMPLERIDSQAAELSDVEELHHIHLCDWMSHLAYMKKDADTFDPKGSEVAGARFSDYCNLVKREQERYKHKPREIAYGGL
jgi:hypothetical protein